jgi:Ca-activated chloride channel family protein
MKPLQDYYAILGIAPDASADDIKTAYRRAARRFHPDANPNPGAAAHFRDIAEAYDALGNNSSRSDYDLSLSREGLPPPYFSLRVTPSKRVLKCLAEPQIIYVLVELTPDPRFDQADSHDTNLNLSLVIDRSTSMKGPRLERVIQAAHRIIDNLGPTDVLSVVHECHGAPHPQGNDEHDAGQWRDRDFPGSSRWREGTAPLAAHAVRQPPDSPDGRPNLWG